MSSVSAFEAASMVTRTDMTLPWSCGQRCGTLTEESCRRCRSETRYRWDLAAQTPAADAHVREEQDDEDDCQDDVENHWASSSNRNDAFLRSIFGFRSNVLPVRGVRIRRWG